MDWGLQQTRETDAGRCCLLLSHSYNPSTPIICRFFSQFEQGALVRRGRRPQEWGREQGRWLYIEGDVEEGVMRGGCVPAGTACHIRLQHAAKDALQRAVSFRFTCKRSKLLLQLLLFRDPRKPPEAHGSSGSLLLPYTIWLRYLGNEDQATSQPAQGCFDDPQLPEHRDKTRGTGTTGCRTCLVAKCGVMAVLKMLPTCCCP